jgi:hypothetical protein
MTQQYMFLLFDDESWHDNLSDQDWEQAMRAHQAFAEAVEAAGGRILDGKALKHSRTSTTVRNGSEDGPLTTDGPFIETKEAIGGYYIVETADLDEALALAAKCPSSIVEVRPVLDTATPPAERSA